ncbi:MAG: hypothetical protein FJ271_22010 [Planctomycetes bacterium]|nr:hypothetical protein [Planctomycetota bacterium]
MFQPAWSSFGRLDSAGGEVCRQAAWDVKKGAITTPKTRCSEGSRLHFLFTGIIPASLPDSMKNRPLHTRNIDKQAATKLHHKTLCNSYLWLVGFDVEIRQKTPNFAFKTGAIGRSATPPDCCLLGLRECRGGSPGLSLPERGSVEKHGRSPAGEWQEWIRCVAAHDHQPARRLPGSF